MTESLTGIKCGLLDVMTMNRGILSPDSNNNADNTLIRRCHCADSLARPGLALRYSEKKGSESKYPGPFDCPIDLCPASLSGDSPKGCIRLSWGSPIPQFLNALQRLHHQLFCLAHNAA